MNRILLTISVVTVVSGLCGQTAREPTLSSQIQKVAETKYGYEVSVLIKNIGDDPAMLARSHTKSPILQSLDIQQWDSKLGWQSVGPCLDVPPTRAVAIPAHQQIEDIVPIGDLDHGWSSSVCARSIQRLGGKIRAVVYCVYKTDEEYKHCDDCCKLIRSPDFNLPPLRK